MNSLSRIGLFLNTAKRLRSTSLSEFSFCLNVNIVSFAIKMLTVMEKARFNLSYLIAKGRTNPSRHLWRSLEWFPAAGVNVVPSLRIDRTPP